MTLEKKYPDFLLFLIIMILVAIGICLVFSSTYIMGYKWYGDSYYFLKKQVVFALIGMGTFFFALFIDYHFYKKIILPLLIASILLLLAIFIPGIGHSAGGAKRWIQLGFITFQPSEIAKFAIVLYIADSLTRKHNTEVKTFVKGILPSLIIVGIISLLILKEPDFSTTIIVLGITFLMLFIGGTRITQLFTLFLALVPLGLFILLREGYRRTRLMSFLNPWIDPLDSGFHIIQSLLALGSGGFMGIGLGESRQKYFYLPDQHTDFIFSIIGEELGFIGTTLIIILFLLLAWRGFKIAMNAVEPFGGLLAAGITAMIVFQAFINIGVVTKMIPTTGITLPFISYGGTSLIVNMFCAGILLNISSFRIKEKEEVIN